MPKITHSTTDKIQYDLKFHGMTVATAFRQKNHWLLSRDLPDGTRRARTMKELKEKVWANLPEEAQPAEPAPLSPREATKLFTASGTASYLYAREAAKLWPELPTAQRGAYVHRKLHEANAKWEGATADVSRAWLKANPTLGAYDEAEEARRLAALYPHAGV